MDGRPGPAPRPRTIFPAGIFLMLFLLESLVTGGAVLGYFYHSARSGMVEIESFTKSGAMPLAGVLAGVAESGRRKGTYDRLRAMFAELSGSGVIGEAFYVLGDGTIVAHSNPAAGRSLGGNIASDEFAYNLDLILQPVRRKSRETLFTDYNIISKKIRYPREARELMKRYLYRSIDTTGWLVSRAVFEGEKPVGAVCFIIGKDRIHAFLSDLIARCRLLLIAALALSFSLSLAVTLVVLVRYRSIQNRMPDSRAADGAAAVTAAAPGPIAVEILDVSDAAPGASPFEGARGVREAIPVRGKE